MTTQMNNDTKTAPETEPVQPGPQAEPRPSAPQSVPLLSDAGAPDEGGPVAAEPAAAQPAPAAPKPPPLPTLTPAQIEELRAKAAKASEHWDLFLRAAADLENYKKRTARERLESTRSAQESVLTKLLPVLDNFDMALAATNNSQAGALEALKAGVTLISQQLRQALTETGLEEIDAAGQPFDPRWHEAVSQQECADTPEGHVVRQLRKGYKFRDRLLRPASVIVAKKPGAQ
jgi:molecular chaperone GrpE